MALKKTRTAFRLHVHVFSIVLLGLRFPFQPLAAPQVPSSSHSHVTTSPDPVRNVLHGDEPRAQDSHRSSNEHVAEQRERSVRRPHHGCLGNTNDGLLNVSCVWNVLKKAEREIVKAENFLQRVLNKFHTTSRGKILNHDQRNTAQTNYVNHQDRLGNMPIRGKIVLLVKQLVHVSREFKRSSQFVMCPLHLGRLLDKANHFFLRATRHLKAWHRTKRSDLYASETVDNGFTECAPLAEYMKDVTYRVQWNIGEIKLELLGPR